VVIFAVKTAFVVQCSRIVEHYIGDVNELRYTPSFVKKINKNIKQGVQ